MGSLILADAASSMLSCRDPHAAIEPGVDAVGSYYIIGRILHRFLHCLMKITFMQARPANRRLLAPGPPGLAALRGGCPAGSGGRATLEELIVVSSLYCVGGLESWGLTRNSKDTTAMTGSISIAHHARLIARLYLRD